MYKGQKIPSVMLKCAVPWFVLIGSYVLKGHVNYTEA